MCFSAHKSVCRLSFNIADSTAHLTENDFEELKFIFKNSHDKSNPICGSQLNIIRTGCLRLILVGFSRKLLAAYLDLHNNHTAYCTQSKFYEDYVQQQ